MVNQQLCRGYKFKPLTGMLERVICESGFELKNLAEQVTLILSRALDQIAGLPASEELIRSLSHGDRLFLMIQLQAKIDPSPQWLTVNCQHCEEMIQFQIEPQTMPVKPAGNSFPESSVSLSTGNLRIRVPTGADEEKLAHYADSEESALKLLLPELITSTINEESINSLTQDDLELIDKKLDEMSPQPATLVSIECPYCTFQQQVSIDHYNWVSQSTQILDEEIHTLALNYHWSEKDILELSKNRRKHYLQLIQRSQGKIQQDDFIHSSQGNVL